MKPERTPLLPLLKQYFGFTSFRPLQEAIIQDALAGKDVFAVLPTGGGKSLCFQLPAMARPGLTVVVSPLIALMKDQVDAMQASGIPATFLNSSLAAGESRPRLRGLHNGEFRLLYVAPERLMLSGFLDDLKRWDVKLIAVDEAHCISEWGHDFRPEYRQLAELRGHFPGVPMMALTATATERVRGDIVRQLTLRDAACYVASFDRPNLTYRVLAKNTPQAQALEFVRSRPRESGIIYCQARKTVEMLAQRLNAGGVSARPYHAGLTPKERTEHQELFLRDEVRVICATIAFGMGINKPNVRFVIHYDLPKNLEGYYQETGRAGRDGLPSVCVLLFSAGDVVKQMTFIDEKPDPREQQIARQQLQQMVHYAECAGCRRRELLGYFGEAYGDAPHPASSHPLPMGRGEISSDPASRREPLNERSAALPSRSGSVAQDARKHQSVSSAAAGDSRAPVHREGRGEGSSAQHHLQNVRFNCGGCDNCLSPRETFDGTLAAQKFLSCVYRIRERSRFGVGLNHVVEVLTGAETEKVRKWAHDQLSTYRIGMEHSRVEWGAIGRELVRIGYLRQTSEKFSVLELTEDGLAALKARRKVTLTKPVTAPEPTASRVGEIACDEALFEKLRRLRKRLADERSVPPYIVFSDVALRQMARHYPANDREFSRISGVGEKKQGEFGSVFLAEIAMHMQSNPRQIFADAPPDTAPDARAWINDTTRDTLRRFQGGDSVAQIARGRSLALSTIYSHLATAIESGEKFELDRILDETEQQEIAAAFARTGYGNLTGVREALGNKFDYGLLRIYRAVRGNAAPAPNAAR